MTLAIAVFSGFALALAAPGLTRGLRTGAGAVLALLPAMLAGYFARCIGSVAAGQTLRESYSWAPQLGVELSFYLDGLGLLFALLISAVGALVVIYAAGYLAEHPRLGRFYALLLFFMASMLGVVLADNLFTLYLFWELTSLASYLLIGFDHARQQARQAAWQALLVTSGGGLALLGGIVLLAMAGGTSELSQLAARGDLVREHANYLPILLLVLVGSFTKSAQFPFHFWLPAAMEAPSPVSAYLHSATMVKAGVYLLARLGPVLGGTAAWWYLVTLGGLATMLAGGYLALTDSDLKRVLAYSTVSALGVMVMLVGLGTPQAIQAAVVFLAAHALYKAALFMVAGAVDHHTGTRDVDRLGGLWRALPLTAAAAVLASLSMAGIAPLVGFVAKEMLLQATLDSPAAWWLVPGSVVTGALFVAVACIAGYRVFFRRSAAEANPPHHGPARLWPGPLLLAGTGLALGLSPTLAEPLLGSAAVAVLAGPAPPPAFALWHGFNTALALSAVSIVLGIAVYAQWQRVRAVNRRLGFLLAHGPAAWYDTGLDALNGFARLQTRLVQSGYLRRYVMTILGTMAALGGAALVRGRGWSWQPSASPIRFYEAVLAVVLLAAAIMAVRSRSRLGAVASLGVVGYSVALVFILFGAPDLAMTQFAIETMTVILFVLVLYRLPRFSVYSHRSTRLRDAVIAGLAGVLVSVLVLTATPDPVEPPVSQQFAERSVREAHGRNMVNVILVDFRGFDTLGEIVVLTVAAVGVCALLKLRPARAEEKA